MITDPLTLTARRVERDRIIASALVALEALAIDSATRLGVSHFEYLACYANLHRDTIEHATALVPELLAEIRRELSPIATYRPLE